jgi:hypothetical protein
MPVAVGQQAMTLHCIFYILFMDSPNNTIEAPNAVTWSKEDLAALRDWAGSKVGRERMVEIQCEETETKKLIAGMSSVNPEELKVRYTI